MALSGSLTTPESKGRSVTLNWTATQDIVANTSTISWSLVGSGSAGDYVIVNEVRVTIDGSDVYYRPQNKEKQLYVYQGTVIASGTKTIYHNNDGSRSVTIYIGAGIYYWPISTCVNTQTFTLNIIPRASTISCGQWTLGSSGTINISRASNSFTHTLKYAWGSLTGTIVTKTSNTSVSWTPPLASMANVIPNNTSGGGTLTCETYNGNTLIGSTSIQFTAYVPASVLPSVTSFTATRVNNTVPSNWGIYVQGKSQCTLTAVGAGIYNSTIRSYSIKQGSTVLGSSASVTTPVLNTSGTNTFTVTVTDSRGRTASSTVSISVVAYNVPTISSVLSQRCLQNGTLNDDGTYIKATGTFTHASCSSKNTITSEVYFKQRGSGSWSTGVTFSSGTAVVIAGSASVDNTYDVKYEVTDAFTTVTLTDVVSTSFTTVDFKKGGTGVALGKASEKNNTFECALNAEFTGSVKFSKDTGWVTLNSVTWYRCRSGIVTIVGRSNGTITLTQNAYTTVATIPEAYWPTVSIPFLIHCYGGTMPAQSCFVQATDGAVRIYVNESGKDYWMYSVTYPISD